MTMVVVCAGGPAAELTQLAQYAHRDDTIFIGADCGALYCLERGITPQVIVGDFDSVNASEWQWLTSKVQMIERYAEEKDETDTDLALLKALSFAPQQILLTGVTGGRLDHYEAAMRTIFALQCAHPEITFYIENNSNRMQFFAPGEHTLAQLANYPYISFFAYGSDALAVTLRGVKYETTAEPMPVTSSRFTSNEITAPRMTLQFTAGAILAVRSKDM